jgi:hypothetical protein
MASTALASAIPRFLPSMELSSAGSTEPRSPYQMKALQGASGSFRRTTMKSTKEIQGLAAHGRKRSKCGSV